MDNSSPELFDDLHTEIVNWCRLLDQREKWWLWVLDRKWNWNRVTYRLEWAVNL